MSTFDKHDIIFGKFEKKSVGVVAIRKKNVSYHDPVILNELNCSCLPYNKHLINQAYSLSVWENLNLG